VLSESYQRYESELLGGNTMKVKDLYPVISPYLDIQIGDSKRDVALTSLSYLADSGCEVD